MSKSAEAILKLKIKTEGREELNKVDEGFVELSKSVVEAAAKMALAVAGVTSAIGVLVINSDKYQQVKDAFTRLATSQGEDADKILAKMTELTDGVVSKMDLMVAANKAILLGLPIERFPEMLAIAKGAADATGDSMQFMLDSIVTSLGRQSTLILDNLGIVINLEAAYKTYADTLGTTADKLTEAEKKQAFINDALRIGIENTDKLGTSSDNQAKAWARLIIAVNETTLAFGEKLKPIIVSVFDWLGRVLENVDKLAKSDGMTTFANNVAKGLNIAGEAIQAIGLHFEKSIELAKLLKGYITFNDEDRAQSWRNLEAINDKMVELGQDTVNKNAEIDRKAQDERIKRALDAGKAIADDDLEVAKQIVADRIREDKEKNDKILEADGKRLAEEKKAVAAANKEKHAAAAREAETARLEQVRLDGEAEQKKADEKIAADKRAADEQKRIKDELEKEKEAAAKRTADQEQKFLDDLGAKANTLITSGFQGIATAGVSELTNTLLPGFGTAVGSMFSLLSQDNDKFLETVNTLFSTKFLDNIAQNFPILIQTFAEKLPGLIDALSESLPEIIGPLVEALVENAPQIGVAFATAFADPTFHEKLALAVANGLKDGLRDGPNEFGRVFSEGFKKFLADWPVLREEFGRNVSGVFKDAFNAAIDYVKDRLKIKVEMPSGGIGGGGGATGGLVEEVSSWFGNKGGLVKPVYASKGRLIDFMPKGMDTVPAMLAPGEYVVNAAATSRNRGLLESINSGGGTGAGGGIVVNLTNYGGMLGSDEEARMFAKAIASGVDKELWALRQSGRSISMDPSF